VLRALVFARFERLLNTSPRLCRGYGDFSDDAGLKVAFSFIRADLDRDHVKWEETKAKRIEAGRLGGNKKASKASKSSKS